MASPEKCSSALISRKGSRTMASVKWIKITTDIFSDEKILLIEQMPDADSLLVIWFKLLCMAGKENNYGVFLMRNRMPYTEEMLATIFRRPLNTVRLALSTFEAFGMIEIDEDIISIPNWEKHQNIEGMEKIREQNRIRKQRQRERQKQALLENNNHATERDSHATDKNRIEEDKEKNIYISVIDYLNEKAGTKYKASTKKTQSCIHARIAEGFTIDDFKMVIDKKCADWLNDAKFAQYLRPETLFGTKFESYLNAKVAVKQSANTGIPVGSNQDDLDGLF
jgi:predicted phage replisome organizer/uncharacterized phage protein (TIGR02220 family)